MGGLDHTAVEKAQRADLRNVVASGDRNHYLGSVEEKPPPAP